MIHKSVPCKSRAVRYLYLYFDSVRTRNHSVSVWLVSHTTFDLVFKWNLTDPLVTNPDIELPQLDIAKNFTEDCTLEYSTGTLFVGNFAFSPVWLNDFCFQPPCFCVLTFTCMDINREGNFTCLAVVFNLRRRLGYHLFHTYIPSGLIVVMSWISFWIKPEAIPARVTLGVTSLLTLGRSRFSNIVSTISFFNIFTLATQSTQSQRSLPPVSYVKAIDVWMSSCTLFVFMSLMQFAVKHKKKIILWKIAMHADVFELNDSVHFIGVQPLHGNWHSGKAQSLIWRRT